MAIQELRVGDPYLPIAMRGEGVYFDISSTGLTLVYNFSRPSAKEIEQMQADQPFEIQLTSVAEVLYILTKCGSLNWTEAPYNPHLSRSGTLEKIHDDTSGYALTLMMVDASTNIIQSLRLIGLGNAFSKKLYEKVEELLSKPFDAEMYQNTVRINSLARSTKDLVRMSTTRWKLR